MDGSTNPTTTSSEALTATSSSLHVSNMINSRHYVSPSRPIYSDRFIPSRSGSNFALFHIPSPAPASTPSEGKEEGSSRAYRTRRRRFGRFLLQLGGLVVAEFVGCRIGELCLLVESCSSKVTKLCDLGIDNSMCSVGWSHRGAHLAIGTNNGKVQVCNLAWSKNVNELVSTHGYSQSQIIV